MVETTTFEAAWNRPALIHAPLLHIGSVEVPSSVLPILAPLATTTLTLAIPVMPSLAALTLNGPPAALPAVNKPVPSIVPPLLADHTNAGCGLRVLPSRSAPVALNCCFPSSATVALVGVTTICAEGPTTVTFTTADVPKLPRVSPATAVSA